MIFTTESGMQQVTNLLHQYDELVVLSQDESLIILSGYIQIDCTAREYWVCKKYQVDQSYPHKYSDGKLCTETDSAIRIRFIGGFDLVAWMAEFVETYFFSYEYYQRFGEFPFGERGHNLEGIIETYSDLFHEKDSVKTLRLMGAVSSQRYRGHYPCPCGSGKKYKKCCGK